MKKYFAAALATGIAIGPASALEAGIGGKAGGVGIGAGVSAGSQGGSVGVGASVGGVGGANVGASVGAGSGSVSAGVSASGNVGNAGVSASGNVGTSGAGVSTSVGLGADSSAQNGSAAAPGGQAAATTGSAPTATATATTATTFAKAARQSIVLPPVLRPSKAGQGGLTVGYPFGPLEALTAKPGTPAAVLQACRAAIMSAAKPLGAVRVRAVSAGALRQFGGARTAPIKVRIDYARRGGIEVRQAQVGCRLDKAGRVRAVI